MLNENSLSDFNDHNEFNNNRLNYIEAEKFLRDSQLGLSYDGVPTSDIIKEWVMHFHEIFQRKSLVNDR